MDLRWQIYANNREISNCSEYTWEAINTPGRPALLEADEKIRGCLPLCLFFIAQIFTASHSDVLNQLAPSLLQCLIDCKTTGKGVRHIAKKQSVWWQIIITCCFSDFMCRSQFHRLQKHLMWLYAGSHGRSIKEELIQVIV